MKERGIGKKGQFYLIAAIVIIAVIITTVTISNYIITQPKQTRIYDLAQELNLESAEVIGHGVYSDVNTVALVSDFAEQFVTQYSAEELEDIYFIYGNDENIILIQFIDESQGDVSITIGGVNFIVPVSTTGLSNQTFQRTEGGKVTVTSTDGFRYQFDLEKGENFYFVVAKEGVVVSS